MKWLEIISLRSSEKINRQLADELLKGIPDSDSSTDTPHLVEIRIYHQSVVETDLSIHIYWTSERGAQDKSPLGLRFYSALKPLGLLNHSVWTETTAVQFPPGDGDATSRDIAASPGLKAETKRLEGSRGG